MVIRAPLCLSSSLVRQGLYSWVCIGTGMRLNESEVRFEPIPFTKTLEPLDYYSVIEVFYEAASDYFSKEQISQSLQTGRHMVFCFCFSVFLLWSLDGLVPQGDPEAEQLVVRGCSGCKPKVGKLAGSILKDSSLCPWHLACLCPISIPVLSYFSLFPQGRSQAGDRGKSAY